MILTRLLCYLMQSLEGGSILSVIVIFLNFLIRIFRHLSIITIITNILE